MSLAVLRDGKVAARFHRRAHMRHSSLLVPMIDKVLKKARTPLKAIDCFALSVGPGSFTGLRIGVATVKGFAYSLGKPVVTVPTLDVIAENARRFKGVICPVLDARKKKVYACLFRSDGKVIRKVSKYLLLPAAELMEKVSRYDKIIFLGDGVKFLNGVRIQEKWHPKASVVALLGASLCAKEKFVTAENLEPMYLYSKECDITGR